MDKEQIKDRKQQPIGSTHRVQAKASQVKAQGDDLKYQLNVEQNLSQKKQVSQHGSYTMYVNYLQENNLLVTQKSESDQILQVLKTNQTVKIGKYQFTHKKQLGRGAFGVVYQGCQTNNPNNKVAIKVVSCSFQDFKPNRIQKMNYQLNIMKYLNPDCAVQLLYHGQSQVIDLQRPEKKTLLKCLVMELMDGSLEELYIKQLKPRLQQNKKDAIDYVKQIFFNIVYAYIGCYQNNIAHKDLKPQNILYRKKKQTQEYYQIKIADFGLSFHQTTAPIMGIDGTPAYRSPQQTLSKNFTYKCDIFALGGVLIYLIFGKSPLQLKIVSKNGQLNVKTLEEYLKDYDNQEGLIFKLLKKCLAFQEKDRYQYNQLLINQFFKALILNQSQTELLAKLGQTLRIKGQYEKALYYLQIAKQIKQKIFGQGSIYSVTILNQLGLVYIKLGKYEEAMKNFRQSLQIQQKIKGKGSIDTVETLNNISSVYKHLGDSKKALKIYQQSLEIQQKIQGKGSFATSNTLHEIGLVYVELGDYQNALKCFQQNLQIKQKIKGKAKAKETIDIAVTLNNIGSVYNNLGYYQKALQKYEQSLEIQQKIKGKKSIDTTVALNNIGNIYYKMGDFQKAIKYYEQSLQIVQIITGKGSIDTVGILTNIGLVYHQSGYYKKALKIYQQCLQQCT